MNKSQIKVLMISSDRNILTTNSAVSLRMKAYSNLVDELHIILLSDKKHNLKNAQINENLWVYPTNSITSFLRPLDAADLGKELISNRGFIRGKSLITTDSIECAWAGLKVKRKWRIPLEIQLHTDPLSLYFTGYQNLVRKYFFKKIISQADSVRVVSEDLKRKVSMMTKAPTQVLPIYVDMQKIAESKITFDLHAKYPWHFIMLTVSRLTTEKNLPLALKILSLVRMKYPNTGLVIVGSGPEENNLKSLTKKMRLEGAVVFAGWQNDLTSFYKTANLFLQTSLFEGYGLSLVEAGLNRLPVATTPVGIANELKDGEDVLVYSPSDPNKFAEGIIELMENNYKRENLKNNLEATLVKKLLSKEEYLEQIKLQWEKTALLLNQ